MEIFKGTYSSLHNFLAFVALPNCVAYFSETNAETKDVIQRERGRCLFNAVVSLDCAVEYLFHETRFDDQGPSSVADVLAGNPVLARLRDISNAMKHCVRGKASKNGFAADDTKKHASDLSSTTVKGTVGLEGEVVQLDVSLKTEFDAAAVHALEDAWRYWIRFHQDASAKG